MFKFKSNILLPVCLILLLTNCTNKVNKYSAITNEKSHASTTDIKECERELTALREIDNESYLILELEFEKMMSGSANYANVRSTINTDTKDTIDSLYHYQSAKVCNDIRVAMLNGLIEKSGAVK